MNRNRWLWTAILGGCLALGSACNGLVGNDSVSLWDAGGLSDAASSETSVEGSAGADGGEEAGEEGGNGDATLADGSGEASIDADTGVEDAADSGLPETEGGACTTACTAGATSCVSGQGAVQKCEVQSNGCTEWFTTFTCGAHQTCAVAAGTASCACTSSICTEAGSACQTGQTLVTCAIDGSSCPYVASTMTCASPKSCSGTAPTAACSLTCTNSCSQGQTSCVSGGLATCTLGSNGCWAYGTPVACGSRQSCTGTSGSAACTCNSDPVCGSVGAKACANASATAICTADAQGCVYESGSSTCNGQTCASGSCTGVCAPGQVACSGSQPQSCGPSGTMQNSGSACAATQGLFCAGGACKAPPSCQGAGTSAGTSQCGASGESCCATLEVPGGTFYRTYTNDGSGATGLADPATVTGFQMDKYLVTVGRFRQFVAAWNAGLTLVAGSGKHTYLNGGQGLANSNAPGTYEPGWVKPDYDNYIMLTNAALASGTNPTWTNTPGTQENKPINTVNWYEAYAFCIWDGGFLPSAAEWEYAGAAGAQEREYPWGTATPGTVCPGTGCEYAIYGDYYPNGSGMYGGPAVNIAPVGTATLGAGLWGHLDLVGDMSQWVMDDPASYSACTDCARFSTAGGPGSKVVWGAPFDLSSNFLSVSVSSPSSDDERYGVYNVGFRCSRAP